MTQNKTLWRACTIVTGHSDRVLERASAFQQGCFPGALSSCFLSAGAELWVLEEPAQHPALGSPTLNHRVPFLPEKKPQGECCATGRQQRAHGKNVSYNFKPSFPFGIFSLKMQNSELKQASPRWPYGSRHIHVSLTTQLLSTLLAVSPFSHTRVSRWTVGQPSPASRAPRALSVH